MMHLTRPKTPLKFPRTADFIKETRPRKTREGANRAKFNRKGRERNNAILGLGNM